MGARVTMRVWYPDGTPVPGAAIEGVDRNATGTDRDWTGTTQPDGSHTWANMNTGWNGDYFVFDVSKVDDDGIRWVGGTSDRISQPGEIDVTLHPAYSVELQLQPEVIKRLEQSSEGRQLLDGIGELRAALGSGLLRSPVVLATWVMEGLIRIKADIEGKWNSAYDNLTFGQLISEREIAGLFPSGLQSRVQALAQLRKPSAHNKGGIPHSADGQLAASVVADTSSVWFA